MGRKLTSYVHVVDEDGQAHAFGPGDDVPSWAEKAITNPDVWEADDSAAQPETETVEPGNSSPPARRSGRPREG